MSYRVSWEDTGHTVILCEADGCWSWDEYHQALDQIVELASSVAHRVDIINVRTPGAITPKGLGVPHYRRAAKIMPTNVSRNILVTNSLAENRISVSIMSALMRSIIQSITILTSLEEAHIFIANDRAKTRVSPSPG